MDDRTNKAGATTHVETENATAEGLSYNHQPQPVNELIAAAQRGDLDSVRRLIDSGEATVNDRDDQNVTPLHWAAINAQLATCRYLLDQGADVDAIGGDLQATPLQWAARSGYLYVVQLLIAHGADPNVSDTQGYNALHLVTHSSAVMPLLYVLHQPVTVDARDAQGHTSLMWAAYQGDALSVDLLLKHGASPNLKDDAGLTPLHWSVVRGNRVVIRRLVEMGGDIHAKDAEGRTPRDMAVELKSLGAWKRALEEGGMNEYGVRASQPLSERNTKIAIFVIPAVFFYLIFTTLAILPWYTGIILAMAEFFAMHHIVTRVLLNKNTYTGTVNQSPYFAGIIAASLIWVGFCWARRLLGQTESHPFVHLGFALSLGLCAYNFFRSITLDPGLCPKPANDGELKAIIEDLASEGRLNGQTFCIQCMARKPLRSRHCRNCDRCIARSDHHCPWVWNCVGAGNHRQFLVFVTTLVVGIGLFDYLTYEYFSNALAAASDASTYPVCSALLCEAASIDAFLLCVALWATLQLSWTSVLLLSQFWQVARQLTTFEVSNLGRFGFMGGRGGLAAGGAGAGMQMGHQHRGHASAGGHGHGHGHAHAHEAAGGEDGEGAQEGAEGGGGGAPKHAHAHRRSLCGGLSAPGTCGAFVLNLTGLDRFTRGRAARGLQLASSKDGAARNPFDLGVVRNCRDFWTMGREVGVEYGSVYDVPMEGFEEARRRREAEREEHDGVGRGGGAGGLGGSGSGSGSGSGKGLLARLGLRMGAGRRGYEPLSQV
ncbi:hypothetical protein CONPUDRAFT_157779 [Coniophora puteana RWD-64-598 SS2]|uniref:Palmitoyltransferase n=1 Tax=Coniophora puteana (strain RWD-64-598) TaxID=741705 RepID=A0A5M3MCG4_CONPW|nr:uncharacterized protein CONPUDRAFT_157779 [Coniophora puteana RWD-64-598 SS2]EIW76594.1 hypothetical protein CONPUDRAFT_157779 [Coniophora puteana RWD-64-598 SS2]